MSPVVGIPIDPTQVIAVLVLDESTKHEGAGLRVVFVHELNELRKCVKFIPVHHHRATVP